jgi:hypothetical protein
MSQFNDESSNPGEFQPGTQAAPNIWPPPPAGQTDPAQIFAIPFGAPFKSGTVLARWVVAFLGLGIIFDLLGLIMESVHSDNATMIRALVAGLQALLLIVTGILFFVWTYRSYKNLSAFGTGGLRMTPGWVIGYFFVPFLNLVRPYQAFKEIWQASGVTAVDTGRWSWTSAPISPIVIAWWLLWLLKGISDNIASRFPENYGDDIIYTRFTEVSHVISIAAAICAIFVVKGITARQEAKWESLVGSRTRTVLPQE